MKSPETFLPEGLKIFKRQGNLMELQEPELTEKHKNSGRSEVVKCLCFLVEIPILPLNICDFGQNT